jgi:hypothetical protein
LTINNCQSKSFSNSLDVLPQLIECKIEALAERSAFQFVFNFFVPECQKCGLTEVKTAIITTIPKLVLKLKSQKDSK